MIRFGIVGFGLHGDKRLMPGFQNATRCRVTALSRRDPQRARESAAEYGIPHAFTSTAELCACPEVDAVFVTSPDALHHDDVLEAVRHRKPVLCEKPMAMNAAEARRMLETARNAGVLLGVAHNMRFEETVRWFRERLVAGVVGEPLVARADFFSSLITSPRKWINDPKLATGGPIADIGVHSIDCLRFVLGDEVRAVTTRAHYDESSPLEASACMVLEFGRGTLATVSVSGRAQYQTYVEIVGTKGVLSGLNALKVEHPATVEHRSGFDLLERKTLSNALAYAQQVDAFAAAVEEGREFEVPGEEGLKNQLILDAAFRSASSGRTETV